MPRTEMPCGDLDTISSFDVGTKFHIALFYFRCQLSNVFPGEIASKN